MSSNIVSLPVDNRNRDLPQGSVRFTEDLLDIVREAYDAVRRLYVEHERRLVDYNDIFSGQNFIDSGDYREETREERLRLFNGRLHPKVDGNPWYRGIGISIDKGTVLLYLPWLREGKPYPEIYSLGEVSHESICKIVMEYSERTIELVLELTPKAQKSRKPKLIVV